MSVTTSYMLIVAGLLAAAPTPDKRLDPLRTELERLRAIAVTQDSQTQAKASLGELAGMLAKEAATDDEVNRVYARAEEVRSWLLAHAAERPSPGAGEYSESSTHWIAKNRYLSLAVDRKDLSMVVKTPKHAWHWRQSDEKAVELRDGHTFALTSAGKQEARELRTGFSMGMVISLSEFPDATKSKVDILMHLIDREMIVEIVPVADIPHLATIAFPASIETGNTATDMAVIPRMQGILIPGDWPQDIRYRDLTNSRALYMPWWGEIAQGCGVQTILETADDAGADYAHPPAGPTRIQPLWYSSMNQLRYPRRLRYVFDDEATYVRMAKRYRRYLKETGAFVSLAEKRIRTPNLDRVIGKPVVHIGSLHHVVKGSRFYSTTRPEHNHRLETFDDLAASLRGLKSKGIPAAYVHLDGWGYRGYDNAHPDVLPPGPEQGGWEGLRRFADTCDELGYLFAVHDQYRDFFFSAASFNDQLAIVNWDGSRAEHAEWAGGRQTYLSPRFAPGYVRRNHDAFAAHGVNVRGAYLDVFSVVPLEESFQPGSPVTRSDCARYRRECFDLLRARGYVVSSEEPTDCFVRSLDLVHHGPYPTVPKGYGPGDAQGIPVPLFNLVYHDSILTPWYLTEDGGWGIPKGDAGRLHCVLNAGLPYVSPGASEQQIAQVNEVCALAGRLNLAEMTDHRFLDPQRRVQQTTFSGGTRITVDFTRKTWSVSAAEATQP